MPNRLKKDKVNRQKDVPGGTIKAMYINLFAIIITLN
jgi:hypothetical protein